MIQYSKDRKEHWEAKYGKTPLERERHLRTFTKSDKLRKEDKELQDLFDAIVIEIEDR